MLKRWIFILITTFLLASLPSKYASAGAFEISMGANYDRSNYSPEDYSWTRKLGISLGYHFSERSGIEVGFQDIVKRTKIVSFEDTTFYDRVISANYVQALSGKNFPIQPYLKVGVGQLNRNAEGSYGTGGARPPAQVDSLTGIFGIGTRIYITRSFALRMEATSYLAGAKISTWRDNVSATFGASFYF